MTTRRELLLAGAVLAASPPASSAAPALPWLKRAFHMHTNAQATSVIRQLEVPQPQELQSQWLLRREAARVTMGLMGPGYMMDFHIANQPNILVPLEGTLIVQLKDGSSWSFVPGDILFAEDCTGGGHRSGAGPEGCFSISVQLPKTAHCLDPETEPLELFAARGKPSF